MRYDLNYTMEFRLLGCAKQGSPTRKYAEEMRVPGLFVAGTDTDVGKTHVAAALARTLVASGRRVGVYKPVASGFVTAADEGSDARMLWEAAGRPRTPEAVCPQTFRAAIAPPASARAEGRRVDRDLLVTGLAPWLDVSDVVLVEGAGGLFSPLADDFLVLDLVRTFDLPTVIVDSARLGAIGRSLATVRAARAEGIAVAAVVLSHAVPPLAAQGPASAVAIALDAAAEIASRTGVPAAILDCGAGCMPAGIDWAGLACGQSADRSGAGSAMAQEVRPAGCGAAAPTPPP